MGSRKGLGEVHRNRKDEKAMSNISKTVSDYTDYAKVLEDLTEVINRHSIDNRTNTPDYVLARHLVGSLKLFEDTFLARARWYGAALSESPFGNDESVAGLEVLP